MTISVFLADFQNYLRTQTGNNTTVNIIISTVDYLLRVQVDYFLLTSGIQWIIPPPSKKNQTQARLFQNRFAAKGAFWLNLIIFIKTFIEWNDLYSFCLILFYSFFSCLWLFCSLLLSSILLQESISDFYWYYSGKDVIDEQGQRNFSKAINVAKQVFNTLTEYIQVWRELPLH